MLAWNGKPLFDAGKFYNVRFIKYITVDPSFHGSVNLSRYSGFQGDTVTAFAVPDQHYTFDSYDITGAELTGSRFTIGDEDINIQGNFVPKVYSVSYYNDGNGTLAGSLTTATANMTGTLTATPNSHYLLGNYAVTGGNINGDRLTVTGDCSAKVYFTAEPKYNITLSQQVGGSISADKTTAYSGDIVNLSNTPSAHYNFMNYSLTGAVLTGSQFRMNNQNVTARANFSAWPVRNLTLQQQTGGTIGANKTTGYDGDTVTLSNTAAQNYEFASYSITGATLTGSNFKFGNGNVTAKANFNSIAPAKTFVLSSNRAYNVSATAGNRTGWDNLYKITPSSYNALDFIYAVDYKFKLSGTKTNAKFEAGIEFGGNYYNWNSTAKRWEGDSWERYNVMYNAQSSLNTAMFPIIRTIGAQESSAFKNFGCEYDNNGLYYLTTASNWTNNEVHLKYLGRQKHKNPVSAYMPLRSSFVSSFNPSTNVCLTSGVYGMQYWYVDYMWVYGGFYSGTTNNLRSYPGSSCVTIGLFSTADQAKAYKWLKSM